MHKTKNVEKFNSKQKRCGVLLDTCYYETHVGATTHNQTNSIYNSKTHFARRDYTTLIVEKSCSTKNYIKIGEICQPSGDIVRPSALAIYRPTLGYVLHSQP